MGSLADNKTLMQFIKQLKEKAMVVQYYRSSERGKAGMIWLQQVVIFFLFSMTSWLTSNHVKTK